MTKGASALARLITFVKLFLVLKMLFSTNIPVFNRMSCFLDYTPRSNFYLFQFL